MGTIPCVETGHRCNGLNPINAILRRVPHPGGYVGLAIAVLLTALGVARAQTPAGQPLIANASVEAPEIQILLGQTPATIPQTTSYTNGQGIVGTYFPDGPVTTGGNPFFDTSLTTNGRSCFTCHIPQGGWTISPPQINTAYVNSSGKSPLFQPIDSANCPDAPGAAAAAGSKFVSARTLLFNRGDFRISVNGPNPIGLADDPSTYTTFEGNNSSDPGDNNATATPQWVLTVKKDPTGCENDPKYGLPSNLVSVYRRTMPSANVAFLDPGGRPGSLSGPLFNIMWDAREPSLQQQFVDATEFHGQTDIAPSGADQTAGADFQMTTLSAQITDFIAGDLTGADGSGALGGPQNLYDSHMEANIASLPPFGGGCDIFAVELVPGLCPGIFDATNPADAAGTTFDLFDAFADAVSTVPGEAARRQSIARGEAIFNNRAFTINDVAGLDDVLNGTVDEVSGPNVPGGTASTHPGVCATCHNAENVGNDNFLDPKREGGIMDNSNNTNNPLPPSSDFPLFAFYCPSGTIPFFSNPVNSSYCRDLPGSPTTCDEFDTTDPGLGLADGECNDLGKMKVPVLHNLAARAPYFHGGNVPTLLALVNFYNGRFKIGLSAQDKTDLVNFLNTL